jgi:hypothetical protein
LTSATLDAGIPPHIVSYKIPMTPKAMPIPNSMVLDYS